jgi:hypothetical protein
MLNIITTYTVRLLDFFCVTGQGVRLANPLREGMGLLEYQVMPSLCDVAHDGVLCTFSNRSAPDRGNWCRGPAGQAAWTVHHVQHHTLLGHSPPASQASRRVPPAV